MSAEPIPEFVDPDDEIADDPEARERFEVTDADSAMWAMRKLYERGERVEEVRERGRVELDRLDRRKRAVEDWVEQQTADDRRFMQYLHALLAGYAARQRRDGKGNTVSTPYGQVTTRKAQDRVEIVDPAALAAYAVASGNLDLVKVTPRKNEVKTASLRDAEILPGVEVHRATDEDFTVDVKPGLAEKPAGS